MTTQDLTLYEEYKADPEPEDFQLKFMEWVENDGVRNKRIPEWQTRLRKRLVALNATRSYTDMAENLGISIGTIGRIMRKDRRTISKKKAERLIQIADEALLDATKNGKQ